MTETLIVLAVTSALFFSAVTLISGRQARTEFQVGSRQIEQMLRSQINQTENGFYEKGTDFSCSATGLSVTINESGAREQGTNGSCVLAGAAFHLAAADTWERMAMAAPRLGLGAPDKLNEDLTSAKAVEPTKSSTRMPAGFSFKWGKWYLPNGVLKQSTDNFTFLVLSDVSAVNMEASAVQPLVLRAFVGSVSAFDNTLSSSTAQAASRVELCFQGGVDKSVLVSIGGNQGTAVTSEIKEGLAC